ncbi:MAG: C40 family peptidase [Austwickia sp.]|nr:C40 family peptidase [Austwickia sp.]MBK9102093.1 C40 family peptidase [Austwickia sp.]
MGFGAAAAPLFDQPARDAFNPSNLSSRPSHPALTPHADSAYLTVAARVANLWTAPTAPRPVDAPMCRSNPDPQVWLRALDRLPRHTGRLGLHGRLATQLRRGEPVLVVETLANGWTQVASPWHPRSPHPHGYVGWLAPGQLSHAPWSGTRRDGVPVVTLPRWRTTFLTVARSMTGVPYLWGGATPLGVDCSGLVHLAARAVGVQVPRDADDQWRAARRVSLADVQPGDLYFFAHPGKRAHHVGIATRPGWMLNAPSTGTRVREEAIVGARRASLIGAGRYDGLPQL